MTSRRRWASIIGVVCGAELGVAAVAGGAGIGAWFGFEGALVATVLILILASFVVRRHRPVPTADR